MGHTMGVGTYGTWSSNQSGGVWTGAKGVAMIRQLDGPAASVGCDTAHFWPYGLNYGDENSAFHFVRHVKVVSAMRQDMGIVSSSELHGYDGLFDITAGAELEFSGNSVQLKGVISGGGRLLHSGTGTLTLTAANTYGGGTTVNGGTLELAGASGGTGLIIGALTVNAGATVSLTGGDGTGFGWNNTISSLTVAGGMVNAASGSHIGFSSNASVAMNHGGTIAGNWQWNGDGLLGFSSSGDSTNTINGSLNLRSDAGANHTFNVADGAAAVDLQVNASLTDSYPEAWWLAPSNLVKTGTGTLALTASNSYDGNTTVSAGTLRLGNGTNNTSLADAAAVIVQTGATLHLDYSGTDTIAELWLGGVHKSPGVYSSANGGGFITGPGTLTVLTGPPSDYDNWASANNLTGGSQGDDDHDGIANFAEYAFGLNPKSGGSSSPYLNYPKPGTGTFTYTRRKTSLSGLVFQIWTSTNLINWSEDFGAIQTITNNTVDLETIQVTLGAPQLASPKLFVRIETQAP